MDVVSHQDLPLSQQFARSVERFIRLRWFPPLAIVMVTPAINTLFHLSLPLLLMLAVAAVIAGYNVLLSLYYRRFRPFSFPGLTGLAQAQMALDFAAITTLVFLTGGVESPLLFFYSIHLVLACLFFRMRRIVLNALVLWLALALLFVLQYFGWIPTQSLYAPGYENAGPSLGFVVGVLGALAATWGLAIWLISPIILQVRRAEHIERELREQLGNTLRELQASEQKRMLYRRLLTHELRSPLNAAQSWLRLMEDGYIGSLSEQQKGTVGKILSRLRQMMEMLQDLLDLERKPDEDEKPEPLLLGPLLERITAAYQASMKELGLSLELQVPAEMTVFGRLRDLEGVFSNLVNNAVKYNRPGGHVRIEAQAEGDWSRLTIADTGIGIPENMRQKLFTEFFRAPNAKSHTPHGTGLGLAIVKGLLEKNGGRISVESREGQGTTFSLQLPRLGPPGR